MRRILVSTVLFLLVSSAPGRPRSSTESTFLAATQGRIDSADLDGLILPADGSTLPENVMIALCDTGGVVIEQSAMSSGGKFSFRGLREVEYILRVTADGFQPQDARVNMQFGNVHGMVVYLTPIASSSTKSGKVGSISSHELSMPQPAHELLVAGRTKLHRENNPREALKDFLEAQQKAPDFYEISYEIGMAYLTLGQKPKARVCFVEAITLSKDSFADAEVALGTLLVDQGNLDEGEKKIQRGIQLNPNLWMGYYQRARLKVILGNLVGAESDARQAASLAPMAAINYQLLSTIHLRQKNYPLLLQDIDQYLVLDTDSPAAERTKEVREQVARLLAENSGGAMGEITLSIGVRDARGVPLDEIATARLRSKFEGVDHVATTKESSDVSFSNVLKGPYELLVECPGYRSVAVQLDVSDEQGFLKSYVYMYALNGSSDSDGSTTRRSLTQKTIQEMDQGLADLRKKQYESAQKHFTKAVESAPTAPDAFYLRGKAEVGLDQVELAHKDFEHALQLDPSFERARLSLGELQLQKGDAKGAVATLREAYTDNGAGWSTNYLLATAYAKIGDWKQSEEFAQRAVTLARENAAPALLLLGNVQAAQGEWDAARQSWERLVTEFPKAPESAEAKGKLATAGTHDAKSGAANGTPVLPSGKVAVSQDVEERGWAPPDIDDKEYALASGVSCKAEEVLPRALRRMQTQLANFEKFTATELIEHQEIDRQGRVGPTKSRDFSYLVVVHAAKDHSVYLEELRDGGSNLDAFPTSLVTIGLYNIALLLLQPEYRGEYFYQCQGLTNRRGEAAWKIRFDEKKNAKEHVRVWKRNGVAYDIPIKGLLWIAASSYDVMGVETDLREPVDSLELTRDHLTVNYGPVKFNDGQSQLWLPWTAEMYLELHAKRYHHTHTLTNYIMFNVDSSWKAKYPDDISKTEIQ